MYIPAGTRLPNFRQINCTIYSAGVDWTDGEATDTRYSITYYMPVGIIRDTQAADTEITIVCEGSAAYTAITLTGIMCKYFPAESYTTLADDWIIYEE
ncbi:MAG: hypothetical protein IJP68_07225 [Selenomonadaceae bacterium]|nr:hypothetical protein [Selenomonadaceae bacterium]